MTKTNRIPTKHWLFRYGWIAGVVVAAVVVLIIIIRPSGGKEGLLSVRYGITPYQDSALPVVADRLGWYKESGIDFQLIPLAWGDVITALSSGAIDVAIYNFNSFLPPYENAARGRRKPIFYSPTYVFKGQAIMVHGNVGYETLGETQSEKQSFRSDQLVRVVRQLEGKKIAITKGTELEQIVLEALRIAGLDSERDVTLIHASPEDALAAFLSRDMDAFAAGLTERTEARRHGAIELLVTSDVTLPVIDGIITTIQFANQHGAVLDTLVHLWFKTIRFMEENLAERSKHIRDYLAESASTRYSVEEYNVTWTFNIFPKNPKEANELFNRASSPYYWIKAWDSVNDYLVQEKKISTPVPYSVYWGGEVLQRLSTENYTKHYPAKTRAKHGPSTR